MQDFHSTFANCANNWLLSPCIVGNVLAGKLILGDAPIYLASESLTARELAEHWRAGATASVR